MSLFKSIIGHALGGNLFSAKQWGISGPDKYAINAGDTLGQSFGGSINDWTGATDQMNQQYANQAKLMNQQFKNQMALQKDAQEFNKHAHQNEIADLQAAGLNPVLSAGGQGTAAAGQGAAASGSASTSTGNDPIAMVGQIINMMNSSKQTKGMVENMNADSELKTAEAYKTWITSDPEAKKLEKEYDALVQQIKESETRQDLIKAQKGLAEWESRHPIASKVLGGAAGAASGIASAAVMGRAMQLGQKARMNSAKQPKTHAGTIYTGGTNPNSIPGIFDNSKW